MIARRTFLRRGAITTALAGLGDLGFLAQLPRVSAAEAKLPAKLVQFHPDIEPLVRLLEDTPRGRVLEEVAAKIKRGTTYREILTALQLAGVRNIQPRPVGFKFHAVLVVNSAHLAALASPDTDRWLPIFWAIDAFKSSQAQDVQQGDWVMNPVDEAAVPKSGQARRALIDALDNWDEPAADAAIVGMYRTAGADEIYEILCRYGEAILRSLVFAMLDRVGAKENPSKADLPADRPYRRNLERVKEIRAGWLDGKSDADATREMLAAIRAGSASDTSAKVVELLNRGVASRSIWDALFDGSGELLMRQPGIAALHATTFTNACHYSFQHTRDEETRKILLLQNAAFLPLYRGGKDEGNHIDTLEPLALNESGAGAVEEIFADVSGDKARKLTAARKILTWLEKNPDPKPLADAARRLIFLKGRDSHDYKFSSAVLEDYAVMAPQWRNRFLAASVFNLKGTGDRDNELVQRTRAALNG
jgi:hypothetical protein